MAFIRDFIQKLKNGPAEEQPAVPVKENVSNFMEKFATVMKKSGEDIKQQVKPTAELMGDILRAPARAALSYKMSKDKLKSEVVSRVTGKEPQREFEIKPTGKFEEKLLGKRPITTYDKMGETTREDIKSIAKVDVGKGGGLSIAVAGSLLDLIPGFGSEKKALTESLSAISKANKAEDIVGSVKDIFKAANVSKTDDEIMAIAKNFENVTDEKQIADELALSMKDTVSDMSDFVVGKKKDFDELIKKSGQLEERISLAKQRQPFTPNEFKEDFPVGSEEILSRLRAETSFGLSANRQINKGIENLPFSKQNEILSKSELQIPREQVDTISRFIDTVGENLFDDVGISVWKGSTKQGQYDFMKNLVTIYKKNILDSGGRFDRTVIHELFHSLSRYLPDEKINSVVKQRLRDIDEYSSKNKWIKYVYNKFDDSFKNEISVGDYEKMVKEFETDTSSMKKITDSFEEVRNKFSGKVTGYKFNFDRENYRLKNIDEWFAENLTDKGLERFKQMDDGTKSIIQYGKNILRSFIESIKRVFGRDVAGGLVDDFFKNKYTDIVRNRTNLQRTSERQFLGQTGDVPPRLGGEVFQTFKSKIKEGPEEKSFIQKVKDFPGEFNRKIINRFSPLNKYEKQITGGTVDNIPIARKFEQVAGAAGKAEADIREFENSVIEPIRKNYDDFNAYLALKRTEDRLLSDASLKRVGDFTLDEVRAAINSFEESTDPNIVASFKKASESYQNLMEKSLQLQVDSGRIAKAAYDAIKSENKFYAPFAVMKHIDEGSPVLGSNNMATTESIVKAIRGIKDDDFELKDILQTSAEKIYKSNILAEKNKAMLKLAELAKKDTEGALFKEVSLTKPPGKGNDIVNYFKDGEQKALEVPSDIALALKGASPQEAEIIGAAAQKFYDVMRAGATTGNVAFSIVNLLADSVSTALISKYGINGVKDGLMFPVQFVDSLATAFAGNFKIGKGRLMNEYMDFLKSGAGNSTIAQEFRPGAFKTTVGVKRRGPGVVLDTVAKFSNAMEETGKILGLKRGKMFEDIAKLPPDERAKALERITTEVRNYGGSPDFARRGAAAKDLNILFPFFNARLQGAARDINRLFGADGIKESVKAWTRIGAAIGIPTVGLMSYNLSKDNIDDYMQIPETERANYWMIPRDKYFTDSNGNKIREYSRIPKRNIMKPFANTVEQFMLFLHNKDPKAFKEIADELASYVSPISIEGNTIGERAMSVASGINPLGKVPLELTTNKNFFFKDNLVPKYLEGAEPSEQYKKSTPEIYKKIGNILNISPIKIQHAATGFTGGFTGQFAVGQPEEGRSVLSETPVTKRFFRSASINRSDFEGDIAKSQERQETKRVISKREALELHEQLKSLPKAEANSIVRKLEKEKPQVYSMLKTIVQEEKLDLNYRDKQVKQLGVQNGERALFIYEQAEKLTTKAEKNAYIKEMRDKKILTAQVEEQLIKLIKDNK